MAVKAAYMFCHSRNHDENISTRTLAGYFMIVVVIIFYYVSYSMN